MRQSGVGEPVGLFTSLPILWSETGDVATLIDAKGTPHWARESLAMRGQVIGLDMLGGAAGNGQLAGLGRLVIAQPRPLSPQENVALDDWVRRGGHLLLVVDPMLTEGSAFPLGDPRRLQTVVLLSPILARWGLELRFDDAQPFGERARDVMGVPVPVNLAGYFAIRPQAACQSWSQGLAVACTIGKGRVVALADAAVLEHNDADGARHLAFDTLLNAAFSAR